MDSTSPALRGVFHYLVYPRILVFWTSLRLGYVPHHGIRPLLDGRLIVAETTLFCKVNLVPGSADLRMVLTRNWILAFPAENLNLGWIDHWLTVEHTPHGEFWPLACSAYMFLCLYERGPWGNGGMINGLKLF